MMSSNRGGMLRAFGAACLLISVAAACPAGAQTATAVPAKPLFPVTLDAAFPEPVATFEAVKALILEHYYSDTITSEALYQAAIRGMLRHISPPKDPERATLWPPSAFKRVNDDLRAVRTTLGIKSTYNNNDGALTITAVSPGSPSEGRLYPLDRVMRVNGAPLKDKSLAQIQRVMAGSAGERVRLTVVRDITVLDIEIELKVFSVSDFSISRLSKQVSYLRVNKMSDGISAKVGAALETMVVDGIDAVVLDLRGNTGGVFNEGLKLAELFVPKGGILVHTLQRGGKVNSYRSSNAKSFDLQLDVLVNGTTASAAEMLAESLRGLPEATIIGSSTFGKGVLERTFTLANEYRVKFTLANEYRVKFIVSALYSPERHSWQGHGIKPDVPVPDATQAPATLERLPFESRLKHDPALKTAWYLLQEKRRLLK